MVLLVEHYDHTYIIILRYKGAIEYKVLDNSIRLQDDLVIGVRLPQRTGRMTKQ